MYDRMIPKKHRRPLVADRNCIFSLFKDERHSDPCHDICVTDEHAIAAHTYWHRVTDGIWMDFRKGEDDEYGFSGKLLSVRKEDCSKSPWGTAAISRCIVSIKFMHEYMHVHVDFEVTQLQFRQTEIRVLSEQRRWYEIDDILRRLRRDEKDWLTSLDMEAKRLIDVLPKHISDSLTPMEYQIFMLLDRRLLHTDEEIGRIPMMEFLGVQGVNSPVGSRGVGVGPTVARCAARKIASKWQHLYSTRALEQTEARDLAHSMRNSFNNTCMQFS